MSIFWNEKINVHITRIHSAYKVDMFLVEGEKSAILIDTGYGIGNLKEYVDTLTPLPYEVILTHGHVDHAGGAAAFKKVYLAQKDWELERKHTEEKFRKEFAEMLSGTKVEPADLCKQRSEAYTPLEDGMIFDLGNLTLEVISCPGHTPGCVCVLIKELGILILGDACNSKSFFFFPEALGIAEYEKNLKKLLERKGEFEQVLFFHPDNFGNKAYIIDENLEVCKEIEAGKDDHIPVSMLGYDLFIAKKIDGEDHRIDGKYANIYYSADKV